MFSRNTGTGQLTPLGLVNNVYFEDLVGMALCVSPDGNSLYVAERTSNVVLEYIRGVETVPVQFPPYTANNVDQQLVYGSSTDLTLFRSSGVEGSSLGFLTPTAIRTVTNTYLITVSDYTVLADATSGAFTITLPPSPFMGQTFNVKKIDVTNNIVTLSGNGNSVEGAPTLSIKRQFVSVEVQFNGTFWSII